MRIQAVVPPPPQSLSSALTQIGVRTDSDLLFSAPPVDIFLKLPPDTISLHDFNDFVMRVAQQAAAPAITADMLFEQEKTKDGADLFAEPTIGVKCLDELLGGLAPPRIIEVSGDRGSGKSVRTLPPALVAHVYCASSSLHYRAFFDTWLRITMSVHSGWTLQASSLPMTSLLFWSPTRDM